MVEEFTAAVKREIEQNLDGLLPFSVKAPKVLADILESLVGSVYIDCNLNLELLWKVFRGILEPIVTPKNSDEQPVTTLYEWCQKKGKTGFQELDEGFGERDVTNVFVDGELTSIGSSEQKHIAKLDVSNDGVPLWTLPCSSQPSSEVDEIYCDFKGRRSVIVKALTTEVNGFYKQCDPVHDDKAWVSRKMDRFDVHMDCSILVGECLVDFLVYSSR